MDEAEIEDGGEEGSVEADEAVVLVLQEVEVEVSALEAEGREEAAGGAVVSAAEDAGRTNYTYPIFN